MSEEHMPSRERLRELLIGKRVVEARIDDEGPNPMGYLTLSDGTTLKVWGNDGGCACASGCYPLVELSKCDNVITNVEIDWSEDDHGWERAGEMAGQYRIFVYAGNERINLATFEGTDGNGYYGTGYWIEVLSGPSDVGMSR